MSANRSPITERAFRRRAFESILNAVGEGFRVETGFLDRDLWLRWEQDGLGASHCNYLVDEEGVWLRPRSNWEAQDDGYFTWHPMSELDDDDQPPDLILTPLLPFPFSGNDLAAYVQDGPARAILSLFCACLSDAGGDVSIAAKLAVPAENSGSARHALRSAWEALVEAEKSVGTLEDRHLNPEDIEGRYYSPQRDEESDDDYHARTAPCRAALEAIRQQTPQERSEAWRKQREWQRAIVRQLLGMGKERPRASPREAKEDRQSRRLDRLNALGGSRVPKLGGGWKAGGTSGALIRLAEEEAAAGRPYSDVRDVARDLNAEAERRRTLQTLPTAGGLTRISPAFGVPRATNRKRES